MSLAALYSSNVAFRATLRLLVFVFSFVAAVFSESAGFGMLKVLLEALNRGANIGIAEFATHGGLTIVFFVLAGLGAYVAKKCYW